MSLAMLNNNLDGALGVPFQALPPSESLTFPTELPELHIDNTASTRLTLNLSDFLNLHDDILYQILHLLDPEDGLSLLKVPSLRSLLCPSSSEMAKPLWHYWIRMDGAPECPAGVNILRWVDVLFGEHICDTCGDLNTLPEPRLLRRICQLCRSNPELAVLLPCNSAGLHSSHPLACLPAPDGMPTLSTFQTHLLNMPALCVNVSGVRLENCKDQARTHVIYLNPEWYVVRTKMYTMNDVEMDEYIRQVGEVVTAVYERRVHESYEQKEDELTAWIAKYRTLKKASWVAAQETILATYVPHQ
ncbi:hypothetical protein ONZ45_g14572 [Pleurotus djamor]|nr:hypothetical protein ONZ45_g14572 [Pleurotus djamor]